MKFAFLIDLKEKKQLDAVLASEPFEKSSFTINGFTLKESQQMGLKGGSLVLYFTSEAREIADKLVERLKAVPSAKQLEGDELTKVLQHIEAEETDAAIGFGSIFE